MKSNLCIEDQMFQIGDIVYALTYDMMKYSDVVIEIKLDTDGTIIYETETEKFSNLEVGSYMFNNSEDREDMLNESLEDNIKK